MEKELELLAPGGDLDSIKAAIIAGADAVYCGLNKFNARNRATNISLDELKAVIRLAHEYDCQIFLTLNILILDSEIPSLVRLLNKLVNTNIDGIIVQDLGLLYILSRHFPSLHIHASTQMTTHNKGQVRFLKKLNVERVNLSRELNLTEIKHLTIIATSQKMKTEVFVHGSQCICFSGICYMSSVHGRNSGNRGKCSQPCRDKFQTTDAGIDYPLNLKDNAAWYQIEDLYKTGVYSLKIEGRIKKYDYIYTVVKNYKSRINEIINHKSPINNFEDLYKVFNRDFSNGYLTNNISNEMFIDSPRNYTLKRINDSTPNLTDFERENVKKELLNEKERIKTNIENNIKGLNFEEKPVKIIASGKNGDPLKVTVKTPDSSFEIFSSVNLIDAGKEGLNREMLFKRFKVINDSGYHLEQIDLDGIPGEVYLPFKELSALKSKILTFLNIPTESISPVKLTPLQKEPVQSSPTLSVIISSIEEIQLLYSTDANIYFKLPNNFTNQLDNYVGIFKQNKELIPWFPSILIEHEYINAISFIEKTKPTLLVTDNTGIAYEACNRAIPWIAGPHLNLVNSYALKSLKENFSCSGAFVSDELNKEAIKRIQKPMDFKLYYSIYHPITLMTTRQCLFHNINGCLKYKMDENCIQTCEKNAFINHNKGVDYLVEKSMGNYHRIFSPHNSMNLDIVKELTGKMDSYFIDLSDIRTKTKTYINNKELIGLFQIYINGDLNAAKKLKHFISPTINPAYKASFIR